MDLETLLLIVKLTHLPYAFHLNSSIFIVLKVKGKKNLASYDFK